jgi:hypothetical protein
MDTNKNKKTRTIAPIDTSTTNTSNVNLLDDIGDEVDETEPNTNTESIRKKYDRR